MKPISVKLGDNGYKIHIGSCLLGRAGSLARLSLGPTARRALVVSNSQIDRLYGEALTAALEHQSFRVHRVLMGDGERHKSLATARSLYSRLVENHFERSDVVVALGGGVVGDTAGFAAATFLRGIRIIHIPTTLLAQIDSSIGGKTAVNHPLGKNLIGAFHQPSVVIIDTAVLETLPSREFRSGVFEAIKYGVIGDKALFDRIGRGIGSLENRDQRMLSYLIARCCQLKADVVERDERETGLRRILNFGHTVGHALEAVTQYRRLRHGEAVGLGMRVASLIAEQMGLLDADQRQAIDRTIGLVGPLPNVNSLALDDIISAMSHDKKVIGGRIAFVLPTRIGAVIIRQDVPLRLARRAIRDCLG
jgi:3-dehydroquinate synthase